MASISGYNQLKEYAARQDYPNEFTSVGQVQPPQIARIGESIPRDANGEILYTNSLTPIQRGTAIAVSICVFSLFSSGVLITIAVLTHNPLFYYGLIPAGVMILGSGICALCYFCQQDLQSPGERAEIVEKFRTHGYTLTKINETYGGFGKVVAYQLMGEAPAKTYKTAAHLSAQRAVADRIYNRLECKIYSAYSSATAPARDALSSARDAQTLSVMNTMTTPPPYRAVPVVSTVVTTYNEGYAQARYDQIREQVYPVYKEAMDKLNQAYNHVVTPIEQAFKALPLN